MIIFRLSSILLEIVPYLPSLERKNMEPIISVRNLKKVFKIGDNDVPALNGLDFDIYQGEFIAIVGTSGSGKSTCLNMLAGLEKPSEGEIHIVGEAIEKMSESELVRFRRNHVGFIFQSYNLIPFLNAVENVALPLMFRGVDKEERNKEALHYLELMNIAKEAEHTPNQMSGGQQQRVGIARALVINPEIIFADEPTGNLDSHTTEEVLSLMRKIVEEQKKTLIMVTHDPHIASWSDRQLRIVDGRIVETVLREGSAIEEEILANNGKRPYTVVHPLKNEVKNDERE